jgi:hypothetical protein
MSLLLRVFGIRLKRLTGIRRTPAGTDFDEENARKDGEVRVAATPEFDF